VYLRLSFCSLTYQDSSQRRFAVPCSLTYADAPAAADLNETGH